MRGIFANEKLRLALENLSGAEAPMMGNNEALRRILAYLESGEGIAAQMGDNEAWRRILGSYQGVEIAPMMGNNEALRRIVGELTGEMPFSTNQSLLLTLFAENVSGLQGDEELTADGESLVADGQTLTQ
jgi:hypothetical protein